MKLVKNRKIDRGGDEPRDFRGRGNRINEFASTLCILLGKK